jgi:hypothetical protein
MKLRGIPSAEYENKSFNNRIAELLFGKYNIKYDFSNHSNIVFFFKDS